VYPGIPTWQYNVVIIGTGPDAVYIGDQCEEAGLTVGIVEPGSISLELSKAAFHSGVGFVTTDAQVAVLDPLTGDETEFLSTTAIAMVCDKSFSAGTFFNGLRKLGVKFTGNEQFISTDPDGRTSRLGIFVIGPCGQDSSGRAPDAVPAAKAIITYCEEKLA
jgi:thioredoxin reductase